MMSKKNLMKGIIVFERWDTLGIARMTTDNCKKFKEKARFNILMVLETVLCFAGMNSHLWVKV